VTLSELSQRLSRADFVDGLGIYIDDHEVALAHLRKRLFQVAVRGTRTVPLPGADRPDERRLALSQAVAAFTRDGEVDARRTVLCVPRSQAAFNRVLLPAAAKENLAQVLEYEIENLIPLPREEIFYDYSARDHGEERLEVLLMCIPRRLVQGYLDALEQATVRPRGIVLASTAIADFVSFCRGNGSAPLGLLLTAPGATEVALLAGGRLVSSQLLSVKQVGDAAALERSVARQLAEEALAANDVPLYRWALANGEGPGISLPGEGDLLALARGRLEAPEEFFSSTAPGMLPAVGAALDAVREGTVAVNLLPAEERHGHDEGISLATIILVALSALLVLVWGGSALVKNALLHRELQAQLESIEPQVREVKKLQADVDQLQKEIDTLSEGLEPQVTPLMKELTELIPADAYLTGLNLRSGRLTLDGQARSASDLLTALGKSKRFKNVNFASPTTKQGDKERFSIVAEVVR
jgi:Tfp pilus assembly PilM family ATPase/Tfp pilus assembly protein PilN